MATYITLVKFTDQGIRNVKESPHRAEAFQGLASKLGVTVKSLHWTTGQYDMVTVTECSEEAGMALNLTMAALGNVRTEVLRGYSAQEFQKIIGLMP